jgi:two-component system, chemotaxis family, sensor kinase CheA
MSDFDDEILQMFIEESREHLVDIESDLLTMEEKGAAIDEDLVNKVFRAAHSLKGGASFFGFLKIKDLAHKIENVLSLVRSRELVPNPEVINILLLSFDKLKDMLNRTSESNEVDITEFIVSLTGLTSASLPPEKKESVHTLVDIKLPDGRSLIYVSQFDLDQNQQGGKAVFLLEYDLIHDVQRVGKTPLDLIRQLNDRGTILDCLVDIAAIGTLDDEPSNQLPFYLLCGSTLEALLAKGDIETNPDRVRQLFPREDQPEEGKPESARPAQADPVPPPLPEEPKQPPLRAQPAAVPLPPTPDPPAPPPARSAGPAAAPAGSQPQETSLRVHVGLLENLMNLAGELVLSRNQLLEALTQNDQRGLKASGQRISLVTSELQETIMLTRMQPIGNLFNKFQRVVRDLARDMNKQVRLDIFGSEVEMDKTIIEGLSDPLTHLVRNAVDHGVESPERRRQAGKSLPGVITLSAFHEAGQVNVEIRDDGKGLDPAKIAQSAVAKGLVSAEQVKTMSEKEMMALILLPGLSTAEKVTDLSGRGVGMDVVKTNLNKLGGQITITSELGQGSTFSIKLPLTLAIIPCLLASVNHERFAIPQVNVLELIRIPASQIKDRIEKVGQSEILVLRGKMIPIVDLAQVLGITRVIPETGDGQSQPDPRKKSVDRRSRTQPLFENSSGKEDCEAAENFSAGNKERRSGQDRRYHTSSDLNLIIVTTGVLEYGLVVDALHDSVEIVVKPMGRHFKMLREYMGSTIMGDGRVALILDVAGLAQTSAMTSLEGTTRAAELAVDAEKDKFEDKHSFLIFRGGDKEMCAVPLDLVGRVEQIKAADIEMVAGKRVMQYRGAVMPLLALEDIGDVSALPENANPLVVVFELGGRAIGLVASAPVDVLEVNPVVDQSTLRKPGIIGSSIVKGQTLLLVDIFEVVNLIYPDWLPSKEKAAQAKIQGPAILLAEDSDFFRQQVKKFIEEEGYKVYAGEDGLAAWSLLEKHGAEVQLVVTDIEMPRMDGYGLTKKIKGDSRFSHLPVIAVTSLASEEDMAKGKAAGIDEYQIKLDREKLIEGINSFFQGERTN